METIRFLDKDGTFYIEQPENYNNLYFPSASEKGIKSSLSPNPATRFPNTSGFQNLPFTATST